MLAVYLESFSHLIHDWHFLPLSSALHIPLEKTFSDLLLPVFQSTQYSEIFLLFDLCFYSLLPELTSLRARTAWLVHCGVFSQCQPSTSEVLRSLNQGMHVLPPCGCMRSSMHHIFPSCLCTYFPLDSLFFSHMTCPYYLVWQSYPTSPDQTQGDFILISHSTHVSLSKHWSHCYVLISVSPPELKTT